MDILKSYHIKEKHADEIARDLLMTLNKSSNEDDIKKLIFTIKEVFK